MPAARPLIAEIVGPAGVGKSTLSGMLNRHGGRVRAGITIWGLPLPTLFIGALVSLPTIVFLCFQRNRVRFSDVKLVVRLNALYRRLRIVTADSGPLGSEAFFMDEGVVFALSKLRADSDGRSINLSRRMLRWEQKTIDRWAKMLTTIVWLDSPDILLADRIRGRDKEHRMKDRTDEEILEFLQRYRSSYDGVISELKRRNSISVIKFRTDHASPDLMAEEIFRLIKRAHG